jgi:hypothetical protein
MKRLILLLVATVLVAQSPEQQEPDWGWLGENCEDALEAAMPLTDQDGLVVGYRRYRDLYHGEHEQYFGIGRRREPGQRSYEATLVIPVEASIQQQLLDLHSREPEAGLSALLQKLKIQKHKLRESECPPIKERIADLGNVQFPLRTIPENQIILHPNINRFVVNFLSDEYGASTWNDDHPLVQWAQETRTALMNCVAQP